MYWRGEPGNIDFVLCIINSLVVSKTRYCLYFRRSLNDNMNGGLINYNQIYNICFSVAVKRGPDVTDSQCKMYSSCSGSVWHSGQHSFNQGWYTWWLLTHRNTNTLLLPLSLLQINQSISFCFNLFLVMYFLLFFFVSFLSFCKSVFVYPLGFIEH